MFVCHTKFFRVGALLSIAWLPGCAPRAQVSTYNVPKPDQVFEANHVESSAPLEQQGGELVAQRMLAAMITKETKTWFFKLMGQNDVVAGQAQAFRDWISSVQFTDGAPPEPEWVAPPGWSQLPASGMRFATMAIDGAAVEATVIPLPTPPGDADEYVLSNVNRWREQLQLDEIGANELTEHTEIIELPDAKAVLAEFSGQAPTDGRPPFAGGGLARPGQANDGPRPQAVPDFDVPDGWAPTAGSAISKAAFIVDGNNGTSVVITATDLPASDLLSNVNRWRSQIQLDTIDAAQLEADVQTLDVDGHPGKFVELVAPETASPRESILAVVINVGEFSWFIKLRGDSELAEMEKQHFLGFVASFKFARAR